MYFYPKTQIDLFYSVFKDQKFGRTLYQRAYNILLYLEDYVNTFTKVFSVFLMLLFHSVLNRMFWCCNKEYIKFSAYVIDIIKKKLPCTTTE